MVPVILCGGSGTRLWPISRAQYPKQFCEFFDQSFLFTTYQRLKQLGDPYVITTDSMKELTLKTISISKDQLILEPFGKNTAPALALMCFQFLQQNQQHQVVGVFPSDHLIFNEEAFMQALKLAEQMALKNNIVTLGVSPREPSTAYGYIQICTEDLIKLGDGARAHKVISFKEKPDLETAKKYIEARNYFWNAGIFIFKVSTLIEEFKTHLPELWSKVVKIRPDNLEQIYANLNSQSIDYGIMEKSKNILCVPGDFGWSDVGSWDEVARLFEEAPSLKSQSQANVYSHKSDSNFVYSVKNKTIGLSHVKDLIVVDTPDSLLITQKGYSESVKDLQNLILESTPSYSPFYEKRSWGSFEVLSESKECKVKKVCIQPQKSISYQMHKKRDELWVVVSGFGEVLLNNKVNHVGPNDTVHVQRNMKHKIKNTSENPLVLIEVQTGDYFGEDDIERFE